MRGLTLIAVAGLLAAPLVFADLPAVRADGIETGLAGSMKFPVTSMKARPFKTVVMQQYDFSCGAAVVATMLTHHYGVKTSESTAFKAMYKAGDKAVIRQNGFSFLDMKAYFKSIGMRADGFDLTLDDLQELGVPAITLISLNGYKHFVLIKGIKDQRVLLADPAFGTLSMDRAKFDSIREPIVLIIRNKATVGREHFNQVAEWGLKPAAPLKDGVARNSTMYIDMFGNTW
jgi:predicted double-glycine peptidase